MAEISQKEQLALHEFSVRYRAALAKQHAATDKSLDTVRDAVREQYEQEQEARHDQPIEPPSAGTERQVEDPDAGR